MLAYFVALQAHVISATECYYLFCLAVHEFYVLLYVLCVPEVSGMMKLNMDIYTVFTPIV